MADGRFSVLFRQFFQVGINIRPPEHGYGWVDGIGGGRAAGKRIGREEDKPPYRQFGVAVATWDMYSCKPPAISAMLRRYSWSNGSSFRSWLPNWCPPEVPFS